MFSKLHIFCQTQKLNEIYFILWLKFSSIAIVLNSAMETSNKNRIYLAMAFPAFFLFILYCMQTLQWGMGWDFTHLGIHPLQKDGLFGIFAHPLIHSGWIHLFHNTLPLFALLWGLYYFYKDFASTVFIMAWLIGGLLTWIIGKPGWHIGASGLIYSLAFFLFFSGILRRHIPLIALSLLVVFLYGSMVWNMFPWFADDSTSWEGHLDGALAGTLLAWFYRKEGPQKPDPFADEDEEDVEGYENPEEMVERNIDEEPLKEITPEG